MERVSKRKRVSFGPKFSPELFDKKLPAATPLRRGATPRRKSTPAAGSPLKGLIKRHSLATPRHQAIVEENTAKSSTKSPKKGESPVKSPKAVPPKTVKSPGRSESQAKSPKKATSRKTPAKSPKASPKSLNGEIVSPAKYATPDKPASPLRRKSRSLGKTSLVRRSKSPAKTPNIKKAKLVTTPKRELVSPPEDFKKAVAIRAIHGKDATPKLTAAIRRRAGDTPPRSATRKATPKTSPISKAPSKKVSPSQASRPKLWSEVVRTGIATKPAKQAVPQKVSKVKKAKAAAKPKAKTPKVKVRRGYMYTYCILKYMDKVFCA